MQNRMLRSKLQKLIFASLIVGSIAIAMVMMILNRPPTLARVNGIAISQPQVIYKLKVEQAYGNASVTEETMTVALINDVIEHEIARLAGVAPTVEDIRELSRHADTSSQAPELLKTVKAIFGADIEAYQRLYLAPRITNRKLHAYQSLSPQLQADQRAKIEQVLAEMRRGSSLQQAATAVGLEAKTTDVEDKAIELPDALKQLQPAEAAPKDPLLALLEKREVGEYIPNVVEDDNSYRIIRLLNKAEQRYQIELVRVDKAPYDAWYKAECAKLAVKISDSKLAESIKAKHPGLCWSL